MEYVYVWRNPNNLMSAARTPITSDETTEAASMNNHTHLVLVKLLKVSIWIYASSGYVQTYMATERDRERERDLNINMVIEPTCMRREFLCQLPWILNIQIALTSGQSVRKLLLKSPVSPLFRLVMMIFVLLFLLDHCRGIRPFKKEERKNPTKQRQQDRRGEAEERQG